MDEADMADKEQERFLAEALRQHRAGPRQEYTGECLFCGAILSARLFCDADCRDDWERERRLRNLAGSRDS